MQHCIFEREEVGAAPVDQLLACQSYRFFGDNENPLFNLGELEELDVRQACNQLPVHTDAVGPPYGASHRLRQDFATQVPTPFESEVAGELLNHNVGCFYFRENVGLEDL